MATGDWWRHGVIYQIYPRSFADADGDGVGDLAGITARLDHLNDGTPRSLGVDAIWLSPFYPSPMADFGYDVADYCDVDPVFGTLDDFDRLVAEAHARGIRVVIDLVPNHTSDRHPWFLESRSLQGQPQARLVRLGRLPAGRVAAQQLDERVPAGRQGVDLRRGDRPVVPALVPAPAARPQLVEPRGPRGHGRRHALLAGPGRRRLPGRRRPQDGPRPRAAATTRWSSWTTRTWPRPRRRGTAGGPS